GSTIRSGDRYTILMASALSGTFADNGPVRAPNGVRLQKVYSSNSLTLVATNDLPQPGALYGASVEGGNFKFSFATGSGTNYIVEYVNSIDQTNWLLLTNVIDDGTSVQISDPMTAPQRFYRTRADR